MACSKKVAFLLYDGCTLLDFVGATQVFTHWAAGWEPIWVAEKKGIVCTSEGLSVNANYALSDSMDPDIVFVPGGSGKGLAHAMQSKPHLDWLKDQAAKGDQRWVGAVCVGIFLLAAADVIRKAKVTTHWLLIDQLKRLQHLRHFEVVDGFPRSQIDCGERRFSGGGVSASIDLALALVKELGSVEKANEAALIIQYDPKLPQGISPGSPTQTDPKTLNALKSNPTIQTNFVGKITAAVTKQLS